jgi:hypothetical protein
MTIEASQAAPAANLPTASGAGTTLLCSATPHRAVGDLCVAMRDCNSLFFMQAEKELGALVPEMVDQAVVQASKTRSRVQRDEVQSEAPENVCQRITTP